MTFDTPRVRVHFIANLEVTDPRPYITVSLPQEGVTLHRNTLRIGARFLSDEILTTGRFCWEKCYEP